MVLRLFALLTGILLLGLISWVVDPINEHLMAKTLFTLAGLYFILAIVLERHMSRRIEDRRTGHGLRKVLTFPGAVFAKWVQYADRIRPGSDARGTDAFPEARVVMEPRRMT